MKVEARIAQIKNEQRVKLEKGEYMPFPRSTDLWPTVRPPSNHPLILTSCHVLRLWIQVQSLDSTDDESDSDITGDEMTDAKKVGQPTCSFTKGRFTKAFLQFNGYGLTGSIGPQDSADQV